MLKLDFNSLNEIRETFYCFDFKNSLDDKQKIKVNKFLDPKVHYFKDGFYCIIAKK